MQIVCHYSKYLSDHVKHWDVMYKLLIIPLHVSSWKTIWDRYSFGVRWRHLSGSQITTGQVFTRSGKDELRRISKNSRGWEHVSSLECHTSCHLSTSTISSSIGRNFVEVMTWLHLFAISPGRISWVSPDWEAFRRTIWLPLRTKSVRLWMVSIFVSCFINEINLWFLST